jgi:hypothetical protein
LGAAAEVSSVAAKSPAAPVEVINFRRFIFIFWQPAHFL